MKLLIRMRFITRVLLCATALLLLAMAPAAQARPMEAFTISSYDVQAVISEDNTYDVSETIVVQFSSARHGIYRDIPYSGTWVRDEAHGGSTKWRARVSNVRVEGAPYDVTRANGNVRVKIGDPDRLVSGEQTYRVSYRIQFGDDGVPDFDEVYFNLIGPSWDTTIDRVTFSVTLPKAFDPATVGFSTGQAGSQGYNTEALTFHVDGNTISGELTQQLYNFDAFTLRVQLPQGYFQFPDLRGWDWFVLVLILLLTVGCVVLFLLYGIDDKPVKTVEFYAPEGMTPSEVGYVIDGCVDTRDVVSLLLYWAHRGYLSIEDTGNSEFTLRKLRDLDPGAKSFEAHMFAKLFKSGDEVTSSSLQNTFYTTIGTTRSMVTDSFARKDRMVFTTISSWLKPLMSLATALPVMMTLWLVYYRDTLDFMETLIATALVGGLILLPVYFLIGTMRNWRVRRPAARVAMLLGSLVLCLAAVVGFLIITANSPLAMLPWVAAMATVVLGLVAVFIIKRTPKGVEWLGKVLGFRDFLELAERDKLVALVEQDPKYFYNVLPYAWVLNVSDKLAKKFETIAIQPPDWYYGHGGMFHPVLFMSSLNHSMLAMQSTMTSRPQPSGSGSGGGGGFSGGGFSGGGGGGGGGGSW